jgi:hypothetical protein
MCDPTKQGVIQDQNHAENASASFYKKRKKRDGYYKTSGSYLILVVPEPGRVMPVSNNQSLKLTMTLTYYSGSWLKFASLMYATAYFFNVKQPRNGKTKEVDMVFYLDSIRWIRKSRSRRVEINELHP